MRLSFTQKFNQEKKIESQVAKKWGYQLAETSEQGVKYSVSQQKQININKNIKPLQMETAKPNPSPKHLLLLKQIQRLQHEKKLYQKNDQAGRDIIKMMNQRIKQYNFLVDHKHLKDKYATQKVQSKMNSQSEGDKLLEQIKTRNKQLLRAEDFAEQYELNKKIGQLYRKYKDLLDRPTSDDNSDKKNMYKTIHTAQKRKNSVQLQQGKTRNYSQYMSSTKIRLVPQQYTTEIETDRCNSKIDQFLGELNEDQPYINQEQIKKNNELERRQELNNEIIDVFRGKINNLTMVLRQKKIRQQQKKKKKLELQELNKSVINNESQMFMNKTYNPFTQMIEDKRLSSGIDENIISQLREKKKTQQKYFSTFLQKRNRKYKKPWGNKILIKYDSKIEAKGMLQGSPSLNNTMTNTRVHNFPSQPHTQLNSTTRDLRSHSLYIPPKNLSPEDAELFQSVTKQKNNNQVYEIMRKNQKINLFLKAKKKHP